MFLELPTLFKGDYLSWLHDYGLWELHVIQDMCTRRYSLCFISIYITIPPTPIFKLTFIYWNALHIMQYKLILIICLKTVWIISVSVWDVLCYVIYANPYRYLCQGRVQITLSHYSHSVRTRPLTCSFIHKSQRFVVSNETLNKSTLTQYIQSQ